MSNHDKLLEYAMAQDVPFAEIERLIAKQAEQDYHAALSRFRCECPPIYKTVQGDGYNYESLADAISVMADTLAAHGLSFFWIPAVNQENSLINVTCKLSHEGGHSEMATLSAPADTNPDLSPAQAIKSTVSYLERVTLFSVLGIAAQDSDKDGENMPEPLMRVTLISQEEADELEALYAEAGGDYNLLLKPFTTGTEFKDLPHWAFFAVREKLLERING